MPTIQANSDTSYFRIVPLSHCPFRSKYCGSQRLGAQGVAVLFDVDWHHDSVARHGCFCVLDLSVKGVLVPWRVCSASRGSRGGHFACLRLRTVSCPVRTFRDVGTRLACFWWNLLARASLSNALQSYEKILRLPWICSLLVGVWSHFLKKRQL